MVTARDHVREQLELNDCLNFGEDVESTVVPRWKRKALAARTPKSSRKAKQTPKQDRFIPNRGAMDLSNRPLYLKENDSSAANTQSPTRTEFNKALADNLGQSDHRVLAFKKKAPKPVDGFQSSLKVVYTQNKSKQKMVKRTRHISSAPERILDAPDLLDDYYLNLIDWGAANILAVALGGTVYLWDAEKGKIQELCQSSNEEDYITSVKFVTEGGGYLAVGTAFAETQLWDIESCKLLRSMDGHNDRVSSLSWNDHILSSGGRDSVVVNHDVRVADHKVGVLKGHEQEVCGLAWSPDGQTLASGGNDNLLCLWDAKNGMSMGSTWQPRLKRAEHQAAVKALAWCPYQRNVLATGGGTADRTIKIWNSGNGCVINSVDTGSQVCSLLWNPHEKELLSSHGFSENQLSLWKYPSMARVKELTGHTARVLHMSLSPCGTMVCSAAADETLRFWKVFEPSKKAKADKTASTGRSALSGMHLR